MIRKEIPTIVQIPTVIQQKPKAKKRNHLGEITNNTPSQNRPVQEGLVLEHDPELDDTVQEAETRRNAEAQRKADTLREAMLQAGLVSELDDAEEWLDGTRDENQPL